MNKSRELEVRVIEAAGGWAWYGQAYTIFKRAPFTWIAMVLIATLITMAMAASVPLLGGLLATGLNALFSAGFFHACAVSDRGEAVRVEHLFEAFRNRLGSILGLAAIGLGAGILALLVGVAFFALLSPMTFADFLRLFQKGSEADPSQLLLLFPALLGSLLAALLVYFPFVMATWYAPALIIIDGRGTIEAMKLSFRGVAGNWLALTVYGLAALPISLLAVITFGLALIVMIPVFQITIYTSYREVFVAKEEPPQP
ncbi:MAG: hypothetical protein NDJ89_06925 [Oligoflexia bacterium]|nr:hypothetical protein [Oligoflexia bacterium]